MTEWTKLEMLVLEKLEKLECQVKENNDELVKIKQDMAVLKAAGNGFGNAPRWLWPLLIAAGTFVGGAAGGGAAQIAQTETAKPVQQIEFRAADLTP